MAVILNTKTDAPHDRLTALLEAAGHQSIPCPLLRVVRLSQESPVPAAVGGVILTSAHGARHVPASVSRALPTAAVGPGTAAAAQTAGFANIYQGEGDGLDLLNNLPALDAAWLWPCAQEPARDLDRAAATLGITLIRYPVYASVPVSALPDTAATMQSRTDAVALLSPRGAMVASGLINPVQASGMTLLTLSDAVAAATTLPWRDVRIAATPRLEDLVALLPLA